jgi:hypothetical protein
VEAPLWRRQVQRVSGADDAAVRRDCLQHTQPAGSTIRNLRFRFAEHNSPLLLYRGGPR